MKRYDSSRTRWRQGLLNWLWLFWPTCPAHGLSGETPVVWCDRPLWHGGDHAFGTGFGAVRWPKDGAR